MRGMFRKATRASDTTETYWSRQESHEIELGNSTSGSESGGSQTGPLENRGDNHGGKDSIPATSSSHTEKEVDNQSNWDWSAGKLRVPDKNNHNTTDVDSTASQPTQGQADEIRVTRSRLIVILSISVAAAMVAFAIFRLASEQEVIGYKSKLEDASDQILEVLHIKSANSMDFLNSWSLHLTSTLPTSDATWPFVTIPNFERQGQDALEKTGARLLSICPIVSESNKIKWEKYSVENQDWIYETLGVPEQEVGISSVIFRPLFPRLNATVPLYEDNYLPIWQTAPIDGNQMMVNYDIFNYSVVPKVFETMMETRAPVLSETINAIPDAYGPPEAFVSVPIFESLLPKSNVVGLILALMQWQEYFVDLMPEGTPPMVAVVRNPCTESFSYRIIGPSVVYLGLGDFHDPAFAADEATTDLAVFQSVSGCENSVHIYPTQEFHDTCMTNRPMLYTSFAICLFLLTAGSFHLYDVMIQRRHKKIIKAATLSNALVTSLFPENVRSRIIREESKRRRAGNPETPSLEAKSNASIELPKGGKPIADLFPRATVLFADIAGFTAWSSSREPSQVFTLLESIYNSFDRIANKCRVFKVETIGDCYVAAAGLPDPRDDHAVIMARFAVLCMRRFRDVVMELEVMLGPDTADLGLRAGLHSGPVTAGVLRGEKSRFQLFGDTVNVASRMESTGASNQIHISQATADLVISECDELSVKPREQMLEIKGKGKMQTYWLIAENDPEPTEEKEESEALDVQLKYTSFVGDNLTQSIRTPTALPACEKQKRLIDWNVDVLQSLLKKVVAMRSDESKKPTRKLAKLKIERDDGQMVIDEVKEVIDIRGVKSNYKRDPDTIELGSVVTAQLRDFVTVVAQHYRPNHFHSFEHASHVTQSVIKLLGRIIAPEGIDYDNLTYRKKEDAVLHYYTYGITSDPLTQFAAAFSALIHDLDHKGVPNATLVKERSEEATRYKNKSVAEQNSVDLAWELLMKPEYVDLRACIYNSRKEFQRFRQLVVNAVMATDIVDKELKSLRNKRWETAFSSSQETTLPDSDTVDPLQRSAEDMNRKATIVIEHLIQASDVSHTMQHWHVYQKWNQRLFFECYFAYLDGRSDIDPADGWYDGELGFFDFYIIPLAKKLKECGVFGVSSDEFLQYAESNRAEWEEKGQDLVEQYIAAYKEHIFGGFR